VNLASRIETACEPGRIYVSEQVREHLNDGLATALVGDFELKGIEGKTSLYELVDWA
jgi:class 3 adenylate cyclase